MMLFLMINMLFVNIALTTVATVDYTSSYYYSLKELTNRGLPSVTSVAPPGFTTFVEIDIPTREVKNLSFPYCFFREELLNYCCGDDRSLCPQKPRANSRITPYAYCLVSEHWPQDNISVWINNTVFGPSNVSWIGYNMYCACQMPGRAVYVSENPRPQPEFYSCHKDNVLWAMMIIIAVAWFFLILYCIYLLFVKVNIMIKSGALKYNEVNGLLKIFTSLTIIWFICCGILRLTSLIFVMIKKLSDPKNSNTNGWLGFCCLVGSSWVVFLFATMAGKIKRINKDRPTFTILTTCKYIFALLTGSILFTLIGLHAFALTNVKNAIDSYYFKDAQYYGEQAQTYVRYELYIAIGLLFIVIIGYTSLIIFTFAQLGFNPFQKTYISVFIKRVYFLCGATIGVCLYLSFQFVYIFTISHDTGAYWTNDEFESNTAGLWCQFFGALFQFIWVLFTVLAISVVKDKSVGESYESDMKITPKSSTTDKGDNTTSVSQMGSVSNMNDL